MNLVLKTKLVDFDIKCRTLWESMDEIQFVNPEILNGEEYKEDLYKAFDRIKNAIFLGTPSQVYGISERGHKVSLVAPVVAPASIIEESTTKLEEYPPGTHLYVNGKWSMI